MARLYKITNSPPTAATSIAPTVERASRPTTRTAPTTTWLPTRIPSSRDSSTAGPMHRLKSKWVRLQVKVHHHDGADGAEGRPKMARRRANEEANRLLRARKSVRAVPA